MVVNVNLDPEFNCPTLIQNLIQWPSPRSINTVSSQIVQVDWKNIGVASELPERVLTYR